MVFRGNGGLSVVANIVQKGVQYKIDCQFGGGGGLFKILKCPQNFEFYTTVG